MFIKKIGRNAGAEEEMIKNAADIEFDKKI